MESVGRKDSVVMMDGREGAVVQKGLEAVVMYEWKVARSGREARAGMKLYRRPGSCCICRSQARASRRQGTPSAASLAPSTVTIDNNFGLIQ